MKPTSVLSMSSKAAATLLGSTVALAPGAWASADHDEHTTHWASGKAQFLRLDNGLDLRYVKAGNGPSLVLLHTMRTQLDYFERLVPQLQGQYQVYALDLPGHGKSGMPAVDCTEEFFRSAVKEFITKLDLHDVTVVGESIGGVLALTASSEMPQRVARIVALNPYDYGESFGGGIRRSANGWMVGMFEVFGSHTFEPRFVTSAVLSGGFHDATHLSEEMLDEFARTGSRDGYRRVEHSVFKNWLTWLEARHLYSDVKVPVTFIYGSHDWSLPAERARNRQAIPGSQLFTIEGAGHFTALEKPGEVASLILQRAM